MAELIIYESRNSIDTLYHSETDTGGIDVQMTLPEGIWELVDISLLLRADNYSGGNHLPIGVEANSVSRMGVIPPLGNVMQLGSEYFMFTYGTDKPWILLSSDVLRCQAPDYSTSVGSTLYFYIRARRMR